MAESMPARLADPLSVKVPQRSAQVIEFSTKLPLAMADALETGCYNAAIRMSSACIMPILRSWSDPSFVAVYSTRCGIIKRLLPMGLAERLLRAELDPAAAGHMTEFELMPSAYNNEIREVESRNNSHTDIKYSTLYTCDLCKQQKYKMVEQQTRSLDEGKTYKCICICGNFWYIQ